MKEYGIYIRCNGGKPYMIHIYDNIYSAKQQLYNMISLEEERGRPYYVDNDFYKNKYPLGINLKYYCIKVRDVSEYSVYSEEEYKTEEKNKIVYLNNYKNNC